MRGIEIGETGDFGVELQANRSGRSVPLLADNDLRLTVNGIHLGQPFIVIGCSRTRLFVRQIIFLAVDEKDDIRILLDRA